MRELRVLPLQMKNHYLPNRRGTYDHQFEDGHWSLSDFIEPLPQCEIIFNPVTGTVVMVGVHISSRGIAPLKTTLDLFPPSSLFNYLRNISLLHLRSDVHGESPSLGLNQPRKGSDQAHEAFLPRLWQHGLGPTWRLVRLQVYIIALTDCYIHALQNRKRLFQVCLETWQELYYWTINSKTEGDLPAISLAFFTENDWEWWNIRIGSKCIAVRSTLWDAATLVGHHADTILHLLLQWFLIKRVVNLSWSSVYETCWATAFFFPSLLFIMSLDFDKLEDIYRQTVAVSYASGELFLVLLSTASIMSLSAVALAVVALYDHCKAVHKNTRGGVSLTTREKL